MIKHIHKKPSLLSALFVIFSIPDMITHFGPSDCYFESEEGEIYYYNDEDAAAIPAADCIHEYTTGYFFKHESHSDGSCNEYKYEARRCRICTHVDRAALANDFYYNVCPH